MVSGALKFENSDRTFTEREREREHLAACDRIAAYIDRSTQCAHGVIKNEIKKIEKKSSCL